MTVILKEFFRRRATEESRGGVEKPPPDPEILRYAQDDMEKAEKKS